MQEERDLRHISIAGYHGQLNRILQIFGGVVLLHIETTLGISDLTV